MLLDAPAEARERGPPPSLSQLCEDRLASLLDVDNATALLGLAHDRGCAALRRACLAFLQRAYNPLFQDAGADSPPLPLPARDADAWEAALPGLGGAGDALRRDVLRALYGV